MKLALGSDHAGLPIKNAIAEWLRSPAGGSHRVQDAGTYSSDSCDYPDVATVVAVCVVSGRAARGILVCGTGIGMAMAANKVNGVHAAVSWNQESAVLASEHNHANVLCLPGRFVNVNQARAIVTAFLKTPFAGGRHGRRLKKVRAMERRA